jgi:hypothetical protein
MTVFSKILKGSARIHQLSIDSAKSCNEIYHEGSIIATDQELNVHQISAVEPVWILDVMDNHSDIKCNYYTLVDNALVAAE